MKCTKSSAEKGIENPQTVLINLPQQKASPPHYLIPGSTTISRVEALCFFLTVAGVEREENWEGGVMLPLQSFIFVLLLS